MTDQPKPTPPNSDTSPGPWKYAHGFICDSDGTIIAHTDRRCGTDATVYANGCLLARAPALQQRVDELERALDFRVKYTNAQKGAIETFTADNQRLRELLRRWLATDTDETVDDLTLWIDTQDAIGRTGE